MKAKFVFAFLAIVAIGAVGAEIYSSSNMSRPSDPFRVKIGGDFTLVNQDNQVVTERDFRGKPLVILSGFTQCTVCPTTLNRMTNLLNRLGPDAADIRVALVTVDPERDVPTVLKQYLQAFDKRIVGLTGSSEQLGSFAKNYKVYYKKLPVPDGGYTIDHTTSVLLFDRAGRFEDTLNREDDTVALGQLQNLVKE